MVLLAYGGFCDWLVLVCDLCVGLACDFCGLAGFFVWKVVRLHERVACGKLKQKS